MYTIIYTCRYIYIWISLHDIPIKLLEIHVAPKQRNLRTRVRTVESINSVMDGFQENLSMLMVVIT
jgi:hypothetical protein